MALKLLAVEHFIIIIDFTRLNALEQHCILSPHKDLYDNAAGRYRTVYVGVYAFGCYSYAVQLATEYSELCPGWLGIYGPCERCGVLLCSLARLYVHIHMYICFVHTNNPTLSAFTVILIPHNLCCLQIVSAHKWGIQPTWGHSR